MTASSAEGIPLKPTNQSPYGTGGKRKECCTSVWWPLFCARLLRVFRREDTSWPLKRSTVCATRFLRAR